MSNCRKSTQRKQCIIFPIFPVLWQMGMVSGKTCPLCVALYRCYKNLLLPTDSKGDQLLLLHCNENSIPFSRSNVLAYHNWLILTRIGKCIHSAERSFILILSLWTPKCHSAYFLYCHHYVETRCLALSFRLGVFAITFDRQIQIFPSLHSLVNR